MGQFVVQKNWEIWMFAAEEEGARMEKKNMIKNGGREEEEVAEDIRVCQMTWFLWHSEVTANMRSSVTFSQRANFSSIILKP